MCNSPALVGNDPAAGSRLHRQQYVGAQAHEALPYASRNASRAATTQDPGPKTLDPNLPDYQPLELTATDPASIRQQQLTLAS